MRIVIDTNVLVGACLGKAASNLLIAQCIQQVHTPLMGSALFQEYEDVLARDDLLDHSPLNRSERDELLDIFLASCHWVRIYYRWRPNLPDEGDNHLIELAIAGGATAIITRTPKDLARGELLFPQLRIQTPEQFLEAQQT